MRLVKEGDGWRMTAPSAAPADSAAVEALLTSLERPGGGRGGGRAAPSDLAQYGLDTPQPHGRGARRGRAARRSPLDARRQDAGRRRALRASPAQATRLHRRRPTWRAPSRRSRSTCATATCCTSSATPCARSRSPGPEGGYALARTSAGEWAFTQPLATRAGRWSVDGLLGTLEGLRMESVAAEERERPEESPYGLAKPRAGTLVTLDGAATLESARTRKTCETRPPRARQTRSRPAQATKYYAREAGSRLVAVVPGAARGRPGQGHGGAARQAPAGGRDLRGRGLRGDGRRAARRRYAQERDQGQGRRRVDASGSAPPPTPRTSTPTRSQDALFQIGGVEVAGVRRRAEAPADLRPRRARPEGHAQGTRATPASSSARRTGCYARRTGDAAVLKSTPRRPRSCSRPSARSTVVAQADEILTPYRLRAGAPLRPAGGPGGAGGVQLLEHARLADHHRVCGRVLGAGRACVVGGRTILSTTSMPSTTSPKTA